MNDPSAPSKGEEHLAALTAGKRVPWAEVIVTHIEDVQFVIVYFVIWVHFPKFLHYSPTFCQPVTENIKPDSITSQ